MKTELVIFDCDGVLVDSEPISSRLIAEQLSELGLPISAQQFEKRFAGTAIAEILKYYERETGKKAPDDFEAVYRERSWQAFKAELQPIPGVRELLKTLATRKCVASNGPREKIDFNLNATQLDHFFGNHIFSAYDIKKWKPLPDLYLYAAKSMNTAPHKCIVIEDSIHGVKAAKAAGMKVLGYPGGATPADVLSAGGAEIIYDMKAVTSLL